MSASRKSNHPQEEKLVHCQDYYDKTLDPEARASKIAMLLECCRQIDEA